MKGNSERVPNKNLRTFNGRPLCHWVLATLQRTPAVDEIVVNTDSAEIAEEARSFDVTVMDRPPELCGDDVPMNEINLHDVRQTDGGVYLQTHCTNPLLRPETVYEAITAFKGHPCDSLFTVTPMQTRLWDTNGDPINHNRNELKRTQDLPPVYEENSNCYLFTRDSIERRENRIGNDPAMFVVDEPESMDIDYPIDFKIAEMVHRDWYGENPDPDRIADVGHPDETDGSRLMYS